MSAHEPTVGIVGLGYGRAHVPAFQASGCKVVAVCQRDQGVHVVDLIRWSFGEFTRVVVNAGVAYPARSAPGVNRPADTDDYCTMLAELASGAQVTFAVSRVAHATNEQSLEVWGTDGALRYRLERERPRWYEGALYA